jgi:phospholipid/cholesterol/gamma-HCH transport system substrate-binding protein
MVTQAPRRSALAVAIAFTLSCIGLMIFVWTQFGGTIPFSAQGYRVHIRFTNAANLVPGDDVRISGIDVGKVAAVENSGEYTLATLDLQRQYAPIASDARAILRLKTLLGEVFVALSPGSASAPKLPDGGTLPSDQVEPTQPLDKVLQTLNPRTQRNLDRLLSGLSVGLAGRGPALNDALGNAVQTTGQLDALASILDRDRGTVQGVIRDTGTVLRAVSARRAALQQLVGSGERVLSTTAARNRRLTGTIDALAPLLPRLRTTLDDVHGALTLADPTLKALIPVAPLVAPTLAKLTALGPPARALLHAALPLIDAAHVALPALTKVGRTLPSVLKIVVPVGEQLAPMVALVNRYAPELLSTMGNLAAVGSSSAPGANGQPQRLIRAQPVLSNELLFGQTALAATQRQNAYHSPGELADIARGGLRASNCENASKPLTLPALGSGAPPCMLQPAWNFEGATRYFPHVAAARPPK